MDVGQEQGLRRALRKRCKGVEVVATGSIPRCHIGTCCPDGTTSVAIGITQTLETMTRRYERYVKVKQTPQLWDHGVPEQNVLHRVSGADFAIFLSQVTDAAQTARRALDADSVVESARAWRELLGDAFPKAPGDNGDEKSGKGAYSKRTAVTTIGGGRWG